MSGGGRVNKWTAPDYALIDRAALRNKLSDLRHALNQLETEIEHLVERAGAEARESHEIALNMLRGARELLEVLEARG